MSKVTKIRAMIQEYILSSVDSSGFENCEYFTKCETQEEKISFLKALQDEIDQLESDIKDLESNIEDLENQIVDLNE